MERWQQIESLFQEALERDPAERNAWLREACRGDTELQREVGSLLANHRTATGSESWAAAAAAELIELPGSLQPGQSLGPYRIESFLAAGGMGQVYRATDTRLHREVAIKVSSARFSERFEREARVVASLNHPNICQLHDVGPNYLVMELVEGATLAERIRQGAIPLVESLAIARQVVDALEAAHELRIVHRDLKPGNVKVTPDGTVKVLDFGLAKRGDPPGSGERTEDSPTLTLDTPATRAGMILGTAAYMSPEQVRGKPVDKRADIWAFGVLLYEMLTGQRPFAGETVSETLIEVATKEPDWTRIPSAPGRNVRRLLRRCLDKEPKRRLRDIGDAWELLEEAGQFGDRSDAEARSLRRWLWPGVAALLFLIAAPVLFVHFREKPLAAELIRFQIPSPENNTFPVSPFLSPNGRMIAFSALGPAGRNVLWIRSLDTLDARALPGTEDAGGSSFWSPDSQFVGFATQGKLEKVAVSGGPPQTLCNIAGRWGGGAWSRHGVIIFGSLDGGLMRVSESGGTPSPLTVPNPSREISHTEPAFLPDGRHFVYLRGSTSAEFSGLYPGSVDASPEQQSAQRLAATTSSAVYAPSVDPALGYLLFLREGSLMAQTFDNRRMELEGEAVPIAEGFISTRPFPFSVSENGILAYRTGNPYPNTELKWFDRTGKMLGRVGEPGFNNSVALAPDGTRVAVVRIGPWAGSAGGETRQHDIWLYEFTHESSQRLTFGPAMNNMPVWSPDSSRVAFQANRAGIYGIYQKASSGMGNEDLLLKSSQMNYPYDWSPNGGSLLYGVFAGHYELWLLPLTIDDRKPVRYLASPFNASQARFSPDGRFIAYTSDESGRNEVNVQPFPQAEGGKWTVSRGGGNQPQWRRGGKELFYISADSKVMAVEVTTTPVFRNGNPRALFPVPILGGGTSTNMTRYGVTPDGQKFLIDTLMTRPATIPAGFFTVILNWQRGLK